MQAYCQKKALEVKQVRFLFDGQRVASTSTPKEVWRKMLAFHSSSWTV